MPECSFVNLFFGAVTKGLAVALFVADSITARDKYFYGLQVVVAGIAICINVSLNVCKCIQSIEKMIATLS